MFDITSKLFDRLIETDNGCLEFTGARDSDGYAIVWQGKNRGGHIVAYEYAHGLIPSGMLVCHTCDNPPCCNVDHLFLGTKKDNYNDMITKGREVVRIGADVGMSTLKDEDVLTIRALVSKGHSHRSLGAEYGISHVAIGKIARYETWRHLP